MSLRAEFEPLLISPNGLHATAEECAAAWDREKTSDAQLCEQIALADEWLRKCTKSKTIDRTKPSSYGLKSIASRWHGWGGFGPQIFNGCFLMAASRLGFKMEPQPPRYVSKIKRNDCNAFLNIASWPMAETAGHETDNERKSGHECFDYFGCAGP
jgi:hypothetical protein